MDWALAWALSTEKVASGARIGKAASSAKVLGTFRPQQASHRFGDRQLAAPVASCPRPCARLYGA